MSGDVPPARAGVYLDNPDLIAEVEAKRAAMTSLPAGGDLSPRGWQSASLRPVFPNPSSENADLALSAVPPPAQGRPRSSPPGARNVGDVASAPAAMTAQSQPMAAFGRPQPPTPHGEWDEDALRAILREAPDGALPVPPVPSQAFGGSAFAQGTASTATIVAAPKAAAAMPMAASQTMWPRPQAAATPPQGPALGGDPSDSSPGRYGISGGPTAYYGLGKGGGGDRDPEGGPATPVTAAGEMQLKDFHNAFPLLFTMFCLSVWVVPIWITYHTGQDVNVRHWFSSILLYTPLLFAVYVVAHVFHAIYHGPAKMPIAISSIGSCVILLLIGNWTSIESQKLGNYFSADDCTTFEGKRSLEDQWQQARSYYADCMDKLSAEKGLSFEAVVSKYQITDCPDYDTQVAGGHADWAYLGQLEDLYHCSGWCTEEQQMWASGPAKDACSIAVADILNNKIRWNMMQVVFYNIVVLFCVSLFLVVATPGMNRLEKEKPGVLSNVMSFIRN